MAKRAREESSFRTNPEFIQLLLTTNAESLVPPEGRIFIAQRTDKVVDVWKGLIKHNFSSVPVLQKTKNKYYGFIDMADIVQFAVKTFGREKLGQDVDFWQQFEKEEILQQKTVNDIMVFPSSRRNPFHPVTKGYSLFSAMELLARERGLHRVPVVDENRQLVNLITQSQLLRYLQSHMKELGPIKDKPIAEMRYSQNPVLCVNQDELAITAFEKMMTEEVTGLAVVDSNGKIHDNISMRDLKAIQSDGRMFWRLNQTCHNFLLKIRREFAKEDGRPNSVVTVTTKDKLETVINQCANHGIHRIYIVDEHKKPIGVISLKDILMELITSI
jgi:CBS-domain-containing membrane protein